MCYEILKSGSLGNCTIIDSKIAIDIGIPYKNLKPYTKELKVVCLTHWHSDHMNITTIKKLKREKPTIKYICAYYLVSKLVSECGIDKKDIFVLDLDKWYDIGLCKIKMQDLVHDVPNICYHIEYQGEKLFYATDTEKIEHIVAKGYDVYLLEANYFANEELDKKIDEAKEKGEFTYLERVKQTHLSQDQAISWLYENMEENSKFVFMHMHKDKDKERKD